MNNSLNYRLFDDTLVKEDNLLSVFEDIHDYIYANDGLSPQQTLEEFIKILFLKIVDEQSSLYHFSALFNHEESIINNISDLFLTTKKNYPDVFDIDDKIRLSSASLKYALYKLKDIALLSSSTDAKGLAFQKFLSHREKDGHGQFFTPAPVIDFCVSMLNISCDDKVIDPACGSAGFLLSSLKYIQAHYVNVDLSRIIQNNLYGIEINKSVARLAKMKLFLESNVLPNIICANALVDNIALDGKFDVVLANPPFGAKISEEVILKQFDLGHKLSIENDVLIKKTILNNQNGDILFLERCLKLLKPKGRMAIVLPNGNFENPSLDYLREYIKVKADILAVVNLPQETFIPYGTGVKTSVLFLQKKSKDENFKKSIFFSRITKLGYQGNKNGSPIYKKDNYGKEVRNKNNDFILDEDFSFVINQYACFNRHQDFVESENIFVLNGGDLKNRFDFDFYQPKNRRLITNLQANGAVKLGDICELVKQKSKKLKSLDATIAYVELSDINTHGYEIINATEYKVYELPSRASYDLQENDIITAVAGNSVGTKKHATALVSTEYAETICTNGFRVLRNVSIDKYFLLFYLKSDLFLQQVFMYRTGAAIPNISDTDLANVLVYLPSQKVMDEISQKVRTAIELRQQSVDILSQLEITI